MDRVKGIDGLRALSALAVFAFHGTPWMPGGWIGVDVFFVISGFVITRMLKSEYDSTGRIDIPLFYLRRILRLWPALLVMVATFYLLKNLPVREWLPSITYTSNITRVLWEYPIAIGHTWSLAIEEQFYLLWPLSLLFILKSKRPVFWITVILLVGIIWRLSIVVTQGDEILRICNGTDTRLDGLMAGALIAFIDHKRIAKYWPLGVFVLVFYLTISHTDSGNIVWGFPLLAIASAILIAKVASDQNGLISRFLELPPLRGLGVISYAFYLWHFPVIWYYHSYGRVWCLVATILLAWGSWILIERPIRKNRDAIVGSITGTFSGSPRLNHRYRL